MLYVRPRQTPCLLPSSKNSVILFCRCLTIMYAMSISNDWLTRDSQPPTTKQTLSQCGVPSSRATRNFFVDGSLRLRNGLLRISALKFFTRMSFSLHCNSLTPCRNEVPIVLRQYPCLEHNRKRIRLLLSLVSSPERSHLPGTSDLSSANQWSPPFMK